jgi:hypothetical protein
MDGEPEKASLTCLSPDEHKNNIRDPILHYLGCVDISTRNEFLSIPSNVQQNTSTDKQKNTSTDEQQKVEWRKDCLSELRRIAFLRSKLKEDKEEQHLVDKIDESRKAWKASKEYTDGIREIQKWRRRPESSIKEPEVSETAYDPARDVNTPFMLYKKSKDVSSVYEHDNEKVDPKDAIWGNFPNQKTNVQRLFDKKKSNLLDGGENKDRIKYFHIPSNNMLVSLYASSIYKNGNNKY